MAIMQRLMVCVRAMNICVMHTEGDVINDLPHILMMMNLIISHKEWSGQNWTGRTRSATTVVTVAQLLYLKCMHVLVETSIYVDISTYVLLLM